MPNRSPLPSSRAILLADMILVEAETCKKSLIGVYSRIVAAALPCRRVLHVYAQLADACGEYHFDIELMNLASGGFLHQGRMGPVIAQDRLLPLEIVMHVPCVFMHCGEYELRLMHGSAMVAARKFSVVTPSAAGFPPPPPSPENN